MYHNGATRRMSDILMMYGTAVGSGISQNDPVIIRYRSMMRLSRLPSVYVKKAFCAIGRFVRTRSVNLIGFKNILIPIMSKKVFFLKKNIHYQSGSTTTTTSSVGFACSSQCMTARGLL